MLQYWCWDTCVSSCMHLCTRLLDLAVLTLEGISAHADIDAAPLTIYSKAHGGATLLNVDSTTSV